jgi:hypothetical protein
MCQELTHALAAKNAFYSIRSSARASNVGGWQAAKGDSRYD